MPSPAPTASCIFILDTLHHPFSLSSSAEELSEVGERKAVLSKGQMEGSEILVGRCVESKSLLGEVVS